jgi:hypothetical protein
MNAPDIFALGGRQDDAEILSLFHRWIEGHRMAFRIEDDDEFDAALDQTFDVEDAIGAIPATTAAGLAAKVYIAIRRDFGSGRNKDDAAGLAPRDCDLDSPYAQYMAAIVRDLAHFIPEVAKPAAPVLRILDRAEVEKATGETGGSVS